MIKTVALCVMLIKFTIEQCSTGCLKCSAKNRCVFCDPTNNYYLQNGNCTMSNITNCSVLNSNGECAQCGPTFYLDVPTKKCVEVDKSKLIDNCQTYSNSQTCGTCSKNFYISTGKCVAVTKAVENCDNYLSDGKCSLCSPGFIFNSDRTNCIAQPNVTNCASYTFVNCKSCAPGYIINANLYFYGFAANSGLIRSEIQNYWQGQFSDWISSTSCQKYQDPNCLSATLYNYCIRCKDGYYLSSQKTCKPNPLPSIEGCAIYDSLTTCTGCRNNYYLESPSKCTLIEGDKLIPNCVAYDKSKATVQCVQCSAGKYLVGNSCQNDRVLSFNITNCKTPTADADTCSACEPDFVLTNDKLKCLPKIDNCKEYADSFVTTNNSTCKVCNDKYYLNVQGEATQCMEGGMEGCVVYSSRLACAACDTKTYYVKNNVCVKHLTIQNCVAYSGTEFNQCAQCAQGYYPFLLSRTCSSITVIANCVTYLNEMTCGTCATGYFLQSNKCVPIESAFPNCKAVLTDGSGCSSCATGYALKNLANDKTCSKNHNYITDYCNTVGGNISFKSNNVIDSNSCTDCKENSYPFDLGNLSVCISNSLLETRGLSTPVTGCVQYSNHASPLCLQCTGFLVIPANGARSCIDTCNQVYNTLVADNLDGSINTCYSNTGNTALSLTNCASAIKVYSGNSFTLKCTKFSTDLPIVPLNLPVTDNASFWRDIDNSSVPKVDGAFLYNGFEIFNSVNTDTNGHDDEGSANKACELYWTTGTNLYCYRCKWGYASNFFEIAGPTLKTQCVLIDGCDTTVSYSGFSSQLNQVLSCHKCTGGKAVTVILGTNTDDSTFNVSGLVRSKIAIQCLTPNTAVGATATENSPVAVDGCLVYGWVFDITTAASPVSPTNSKGCLACKPGYKLSAAFGTCSAIANCDTSKSLMANRCSACSQTNADASTNYRAFTDYLATTCVSVKSNNCLIADIFADANNKYDCRVCKPGFWLNYDKVCESFTLSQCADAAGSTNLYALPTFNSISVIAEYYLLKQLAKVQMISGCSSCMTGFTAFKMPSGESQCMASSYVQANSFVASPIKYITDCLNYKNALTVGFNPIAKCTACKNGKILTQDSTRCVANIANCKYADNTDPTKCNTCLSTHVKIATSCVIKSTLNCASYDESANVDQLLCLSCKSGFVLATDKKSCYAGYVSGCDTYATDLPWVCNSCLAGYNLISTANSKTYCIKPNDETNCVSAENGSSDGLQGGFFKCNTCKASNAVAYLPKAYDRTNVNLVQSICVALNLVDKCIQYGVGNSAVASNSLLCTSCMTGYYLNSTTNACVKRTITPSGCIALYDNDNKCKNCSSTTFKNANETECTAFPRGIVRCATYFSDSVCTSCHPPAYLAGNACPLSTVIDYCTLYKANYTCVACQSGYFLANSTSCIKAIAQDCYSYVSARECEKCDPSNPNKGLKRDDAGVVNCVDKNVLNCNTSANEYPFVCTECNQGFYLDTDGSCKPAKIIENCLMYDSDSTCRVCQQGSALAVDRKSCNGTYYSSYVDQNCADSQVLAAPVCSKCRPGFFFANNTCTACAINEFDSGCFSCDPSYQSTCFACRPGYYQNAKGKCVLPPALTDNDDSMQNDSPLTRLHKLLCLLLLALLVQW